MDRWLDGSQSRSGSGGEEKNFQPPPALEPPIIQPVAQRYTTEITRLLGEEYVLEMSATIQYENCCPFDFPKRLRSGYTKH
jgi:hypothetical protein